MMRNIIGYHQQNHQNLYSCLQCFTQVMKIIEEIKNQVEQEMKRMIGKCIEKRYAKLTENLKREFITKVISQQITIRQAAKELCINYSSAKAIMSNYRKQLNNKQKHCEPKLVKFNTQYDWKKFKIQTYCEDTQTNEYTMDSFAHQIIKY